MQVIAMTQIATATEPKETSSPTPASPHLDLSEVDPKSILDLGQRVQHILAMRGDLSLKVATRVTFLIRFTMILFGGLAISMLVMMLIMSSKMGDLTGAIDNMNAHFTHMTEDMKVMRAHVSKMEQSIQAMPNMLTQVDAMNNSMGQMNGSVANMSDDMTSIRQNMDTMRVSVDQIDNNFAHMEQSMGVMRQDVNQMSKPMRLFNQIMGR
jgi:methyl-accepting chemotaxis protein